MEIAALEAQLAAEEGGDAPRIMVHARPGEDPNGPYGRTGPTPISEADDPERLAAVAQNPGELIIVSRIIGSPERADVGDGMGGAREADAVARAADSSREDAGGPVMGDPAPVNELADRIADALPAELQSADREVLRRAYLTLAFRLERERWGTAANGFIRDDALVERRRAGRARLRLPSPPGRC
jgi:hypothetical protein